MLSELNQKKKYRVGYTKLVQRILARYIAGIVAQKDVRTLTDSALDPVVDGLSKDDISKVIQGRFQGLTGLVPPKKEDLQAHINRQNSISRQILKLQPKSVSLSTLKQPDPDSTAFNWTMKGYVAANSGIVTAVQNQQDCGCCWAFATVGAFEAAYAKDKGVLIGASEQYLLDCAGGALTEPPGQSWNCNGGWWAFDLLSSKVNNPGLPLRLVVPYQDAQQPCAGNFDKPYQVLTWGYVTDSTDIPTTKQLKEALCTYGPLVIAIMADSAWFFDQGSVLQDFASDPNNVQVNHAVVLVGWDDSKGDNGAWIIKNSWGTTCGIQVNGSPTGFMYIAYDSNNIGYSAAYVIPQ